MAVIQNLPVELLALVFEHIYQRNRCDTATGDEWKPYDLHNPEVFPCAIALVCRQWRDITARQPHFWTRFGFDLASQEQPLLDASLWAKELTFHVLVFDSRYRPDVEITPSEAAVEVERAAVDRIITALLPHLKRCDHLQYQVSFSTSLPKLPFILLHCSESISTLELDYRLDNSDSTSEELELYIQVAARTNLPALTCLSIDVKSFMLGTMGCPELWEKLIADRKGVNVEIWRYEFCGHTRRKHISSQSGPTLPKERWTLDQFFGRIAALPYNISLTLRDLSVAPGRISLGDGYSGEEGKIELSQPVLNCENLSRDFLAAFFAKFQLGPGSLTSSHATFDRCKFPLNTPYLHFGSLSLLHLPTDARIERVCSGKWGGFRLNVVACPGFNDTFLDILSEGSSFHAVYPADGSINLTIEDCENFTFGALRTLVEERIVSSKGKWAIRVLNVSGLSPSLSDEDATWFKENVNRVVFDLVDTDDSASEA